MLSNNWSFIRFLICFPITNISDCRNLHVKIMNMLWPYFRFCNIYRNPLCSNTNMSMFLVLIFDTSYLRDFGIRNFHLSYSYAKFMPILNSLSVIFHRSLCKFGGNLVYKLGLILYIKLLFIYECNFKNWGIENRDIGCSKNLSLQFEITNNSNSEIGNRQCLRQTKCRAKKNHSKWMK